MSSELTLGQMIHSWRKDQGMTQSELGIELGVSRQAIARYESKGIPTQSQRLVLLALRQLREQQLRKDLASKLRELSNALESHST